MDRKDIPAYVRRCYIAARKADKAQRDAEKERLEFYAGGDHQWRDEEITRRRNQGRPWITVNKCKPAVDQIEGDIRLNPPGPEVMPVGSGSDRETADIFEGMIRECEWRSGAKTAYSTAGKYVAASGCAYLELVTERQPGRSFAQRLRIDSIEDPSTVFFDPSARMANRQDAMWAGKLRMYSKESYIAAFGKDRKVLKSKSVQSSMGWIANAMQSVGLDGMMPDTSSWAEWTGNGEGPYYVAEFYLRELEEKTLTMHSDHIVYWDDEKVPKGVRPLTGPGASQKVMKPKIWKYVVDAVEVIEDTEWYGSLIPIFPILGPEVYIDGKLHRQSLISGALDAQRALNYTFTSMIELVGLMPRSPFIGWKGQFRDERWQTANSELWAFLEIEPVFGTDADGNQQLLPAPQRNTYETSLQWAIQLYRECVDAVKAVTGIYDASLGNQKNDQSGKAIEQLRSESNVGNFSYADNLHRGVSVLYQQMVEIFPKIYDGPRVITIVRPDSQHETITINSIFGEAGSEKERQGKDISQGQFAARAQAGVNYETRQKEAIPLIIDFLKTDPQAIAVPGVAAKVLRLIGQGNQEIEAMADLIAPDPDGNANPGQMQAQLQAAQAQNKQLMEIVQKLQQVLATKQPELDLKKLIAEMDNATKLRVAEINASKDLDKADGDRLAGQFETLAGLAHDTALQTVQQGHEQQMQQSQQQAAAGAQQADQEHETGMQASDQAATAVQSEADREQPEEVTT